MSPYELMQRRKAIWGSLSPEEQARGLYREQNIPHLNWDNFDSIERANSVRRIAYKIEKIGLEEFLDSTPSCRFLDKLEPLGSVRVRIDPLILHIQ